jgi:hypothetical protein
MKTISNILVEEETAHTKLIEQYKKYRQVGLKLNHRIIDICVTHDLLMKSAQLLGINQGNKFFFDTEDESSVLMDFVLNEYRIQNKTVVDTYREKFGGKNQIEKDILDVLSSSYTSLFKVTDIVKRENTLILQDILNKKSNIHLLDIAFSQTMEKAGRHLLFTRLIPFKYFNMTGGAALVFSSTFEQVLLRQYIKERKNVSSNNKNIKRFVAFFKLNKIYGMNVGYI